MGTEDIELIEDINTPSFKNFILNDFRDVIKNINCSNGNNTLSTLIFVSTIISTSLFLGFCLLGVYAVTLWSFITYGEIGTLILFLIETLVFLPFIFLPILYFFIKIYQWIKLK